MIKLTMQLVCDRCGCFDGAFASFDDRTKTASIVMNDLRRQANGVGWEIVRHKGILEDWRPKCMETHVSMRRKEPTT